MCKLPCMLQLKSSSLQGSFMLMLSCLITFNSIKVEDNRHPYEGEDAFLWLPTTFGKSVCYEVLSFARLTV